MNRLKVLAVLSVLLNLPTLALANPLAVDPSLKVELNIVGRCSDSFVDAKQIAPLTNTTRCKLNAQIVGNPNARIPASMITITRSRNGVSKIIKAKFGGSTGQANFRVRLRARTINTFSAEFFSLEE